MEHIYRAGVKTEDMTHDKLAAKYWIDRALSASESSLTRMVASVAIHECIDFVAAERDKKWPDSTD
jgi:hypothetical protein